jgi:O-antigen/teichoic acid export membrane protein
LADILARLLLVPLYLKAWSVGTYGEWLALQSLVYYLANLDFGMSRAAVNAATMAYARGDWDEFKRVQGTAWAFALAVTGIATALIVVPSMVFPVERWLGLREIGSLEARSVAACFAFSLVVTLAGKQLASVYIAIGEFATYQWLYNASAIASSVATALMLFLGARPGTIAAVIVAITLAYIGACGLLLRRRDVRLFPHIASAEWATARRLAAPTFYFFLSLVATTLTLQGPVVLISHVLGGSAVALFVTARTLSNVPRQVSGLLRYPLQPELSALAASNSGARLARVFRTMLSVESLIGASFFAVVWACGPQLVKVWTGGGIVAPPALLRTIAAASVLEGFLLALACVSVVTNRFGWVVLAQLSVAVGCLVAAAPFLATAGVSALPVASLIFLVAILLPVAVREAHVSTHLNTRSILARIVFPFALAVCLSVAAAQVIGTYEGGRPWLAGTGAGLMGIALSSLVLAATFDAQDRRRVGSAILSRLQTKASASA